MTPDFNNDLITNEGDTSFSHTGALFLPTLLLEGEIVNLQTLSKVVVTGRTNYTREFFP